MDQKLPVVQLIDRPRGWKITFMLFLCDNINCLIPVSFVECQDCHVFCVVVQLCNHHM